MSAFHPRRFSRPEVIRRIAPDHLLQFLDPYREYLLSRGVRLPAAAPLGRFDYEGLCQVLLHPDNHTPREMIEALFFINEMSKPEGFDALQDALVDAGLEVEIGEEVTSADLAVQVWLKAPALLERLHAEQLLFHPRSFEYFRTSHSPIPPFRVPDAVAIQALENALDDWFAMKRRGRCSRVFVFVKPDNVWFLVRHGEPFTRESAIQEGKSTCVFFRPERHDVLVYNPIHGEMRIHARSKGEKELYRKQFGAHLFGDPNYFDASGRFSFEQLQKHGADALVCSDIEGMEWVRLKKVRFFRGGEFVENEVLEAEDIFAAMARRKAPFPINITITRCKFEIQFSDSRTPRMVTISSKSKVEFRRDDDAGILEEWMRRRGFIVFEEKDAHGKGFVDVAQN